VNVKDERMNAHYAPQNGCIPRLLSWFGIAGTAPFWIKFYFTSQSVKVNVNNSLFPLFPALSGVPEDPV
jgi:hypothetical protein